MRRFIWNFQKFWLIQTPAPEEDALSTFLNPPHFLLGGVESCHWEGNICPHFPTSTLMDHLLPHHPSQALHLHHLRHHLHLPRIPAPPPPSGMESSLWTHLSPHHSSQSSTVLVARHGSHSRMLSGCLTTTWSVTFPVHHVVSAKSNLWCQSSDYPITIHTIAAQLHLDVMIQKGIALLSGQR